MLLSSFKSAFVLMAIEHLLSKGIEFCKDYTEDNAKQIEEFIKKMIPGEDYDALGWSIVSAALPEIFRVAETLVGKIDGIDDRATRMSEILKAVRGISC
jgi:hypothetical protein